MDKENIKENDYNLNVTLYVYPEEETEEINIKKEWLELLEIDKELLGIQDRLTNYLKELGEIK